MGDTTTRFFSRSERTCSGNSIGGTAADPVAGVAHSGAAAPESRGAGSAAAIQASNPCNQARSRRRRFSWLMRCERVSRE